MPSFCSFACTDCESQEEVSASSDFYSYILHWRTLTSLGIALEEGVRLYEREIEMIVNSNELNKITGKWVRIRCIQNDMEALFRNRLAAQTRDSFANGSMGGFYTLDETFDLLHDFRMRYKTLISAPIEIGRSSEGRPIFAFRVSDNAGVDENEPEVLYTSLHHAREPQSLMTLLYFIERLLHGYGKNAEITYLMRTGNCGLYQLLTRMGTFTMNKPIQAEVDCGGKVGSANADGSFGVDLNQELWI